MINVGEMITRIRRERGYSQTQLAKKLGVTKQTISNYERGLREPDYVMLEAIADVLNVPIAILISSEDQQKALSEIYATYPGKEKPQPDGDTDLTPEERRLIAAWRAADARAREDAMNTLLSHPAATQKENLA